MNDNQRDALNRVRAGWAYCNDFNSFSGTYSTNDIEALLKVLKDQEERLDCVKADLETLRTYINNGEGHAALCMVDSTIYLLSDEDEDL